MKNPLEFSLLEIERLMADDLDRDAVALPQRAYSDLVRYIHHRIKLMREYEVQETAKIIRAKTDELPRRAMRDLDAELLDSAEVVTVDCGAEYSQPPTGDKYDKLLENLGG